LIRIEGNFSEELLQTPPPPCFHWNPARAIACRPYLTYTDIGDASP